MQRNNNFLHCWYHFMHHRFIMKYLFIILFPLTTFCQDSAKWKTGNEAIVYNYQLQKSKDTITWVTIATIAKGKNSYAYALPNETGYYRIKALGVQNFFTKPIFRSVANSANITNALYKTTTLTWTTTGERNVFYYLIEKTSTANKLTLVGKALPKGNSDYTLKISRTIYKYVYQITPVFKDLKKGETIFFK